jgi:hypothetical protein
MKVITWILRSALCLITLCASTLTARAGWAATGALSTNRSGGPVPLLPSGKRYFLAEEVAPDSAVVRDCNAVAPLRND